MGMSIADIFLLSIPLFSSLLLCLSFVSWLNLKACWGPFFTLCAVQIWVYVFSLFDLLYLGAMSITVAPVLFFIFTMIRQKEKASVLKALLSPGMVFFIFFTLTTIVHSYFSYETFRGSDEISFWGLSYKITVLNGSLYPHSDFNYGPFSYPPIPQITWYSYSFLAPGIHEWYVKAMASMCVYAGMSTLFTGIRDDKKIIRLIKILTAFVLAYYIPLTQNKMGAYEFIYSDSMMAVWMAAILCIYFSTRDITWQKLLTACMGLFTLTLCKDMGMVLAAAAGGIIGLDMLYCWMQMKKELRHGLEKSMKTKNNNVNKYVYAVFLFIVCILAARLSWNVYLAQNEKSVPITEVVSSIFQPDQTRQAAEQTSDKATSTQSLAVDNGRALASNEANAANNQEKSLWVTFKKFASKVLRYNTGIGSYPFILFFICVFLAVLALFSPAGLERRRMFLLIISMVAASGLYLVCLFYVYYTYFPKAQLAYFAGYQRYIAPLPIAFLSLLAMRTLQSGEYGGLEMNTRPHRGTAGEILKWVITAVLLIAVIRSTTLALNPFFINKLEPDEKRAIARINQKQFSAVMIPHKDKVFIIAQNDLPNAKTRLISSAAAYEYYPVVVLNPSGPFAFDLPDKRDPSKTGNGDHYDIATYTVYADLDGMKAYIAGTGAAYVIVFKTDPGFIYHYGQAFSDKLQNVSELQPHLYRVSKTEDHILFNLIE